MAGMVLLFDAACPVCRLLAELAARRADGQLEFRSWQEFAADPGVEGGPQASPSTGERAAPKADRLRLWDGKSLLEGDQAWEELLTLHPDLKALNWLAAKLGLQRPATAKILARSGETLRRLCRRCSW